MQPAVNNEGQNVADVTQRQIIEI